MFFSSPKNQMVHPDQAYPGRSKAMVVSGLHRVLGHPIQPPFENGLEQVVFGMGCFWGAEKRFWGLPGVYTTAVGYSGGYTKNPNYEEVCSGMTGHNEVVLVVFDPKKISFSALLKVFWQAHNPTQGMRQGNDMGTQYRSGIYTFTEQQKHQATVSKHAYQCDLSASGFSDITTEICDAGDFYYAEDYHQQYLDKNPHGYCGLGGTGVDCS